MKVLEKILEEIEIEEQKQRQVCKEIIKSPGYRIYEKAVGIVKEIIRSHMVEKEKVTSAKIISREIDGKPYYEIKFKKVGEDEYTVGYSSYKFDYVVKWLNDCFEFCGEDKVYCYNDGWIPVEENQLEAHYDVFLSRETEDLTIDKEIRLDHKPTREELKTLISTHKMKAAWYMKRYCYNPCKGCFGAANNDCGKCEYRGGSSE